MIYYTADLHLGHANVIRHCDRPFASADEMDAALVKNWNAKVHRNDTVYIVGDFLFRARKPAEDYLAELKGRKHLIIGNHDKYWMKKVDLAKWFESVSPMLFVNDGGHSATLCHYPMMSWPGMSRNGYMIYGHIHNNTNADYWPLIASRELMLNAGVDINEFAPVTLEEMIQNNQVFKEKSNQTTMKEDKDNENDIRRSGEGTEEAE